MGDLCRSTPKSSSRQPARNAKMPSDVRISLSLTSKYTHAPFSSQPRDAEPGDGGGAGAGGGNGGGGTLMATPRERRGFGSTLPLAPRAHRDHWLPAKRQPGDSYLFSRGRRVVIGSSRQLGESTFEKLEPPADTFVNKSVPTNDRLPCKWYELEVSLCLQLHIRTAPFDDWPPVGVRLIHRGGFSASGFASTSPSPLKSASRVPLRLCPRAHR